MSRDAGLRLHGEEVTSEDDGTLTLDGPFAAPSASVAPADPTETPPRRRGGRSKDAIWTETTILPDKTVLCNHCHVTVHRYGCAKVERVRAHFQHRCLSANAAAVLERANAANACVASASKCRSQGKSSTKRSSNDKGPSEVLAMTTDVAAATGTAPEKAAAAAKKRRTEYAPTDGTMTAADTARRVATAPPTALAPLATAAAKRTKERTTSSVQATPSATTGATVATSIANPSTIGTFTTRSTADQRVAATTSGLFKRKLAHWLFATAQPLDTVENKLLVSALRVLWADVSLPTRVELEGELLAAESTTAAVRVTKLLADKPFSLALENWTDTTGSTHTSFAALCEGSPYFLETVTPALVAREPVGVDLAAAIERVLSTHRSSCLLSGVVTPETAMLSVASRERLQRQFPQCVFYYGCARHALRELVGDLCSILPWLEQTHASVSELLRVFQTRQTLRGHVPTLLASVDGGCALSGAGGDNWHGGRNDSYTGEGSDCIGGSSSNDSRSDGTAADFFSSRRFFGLIQTILASEKELYAAVSRRDFVDSDTTAEREALKRVQDFVLSETFAQDLERATKVVLPVQQRLEGFERGQLSLADVYHSFSELLRTYASMACVSKKERALISSCVGERLSSIYGDAHGVAYALDPRYLGIDLDGAQKQSVERFIVSYCSSGGESGGIGGVSGIGGTSASVVDPLRILGQLEKYKAMVRELKECNSTYWKMLELREVHVFDFWVERRQFPLLQKLAWAVFSLPCTSTAPARAFGAQCELLHARFRGSLSTEKLQQLAQVYCNAKSTHADLSALELVGGGDGFRAEGEMEHGNAVDESPMIGGAI